MLDVAPVCGCWDCSGDSVFHGIQDKAGSGGRVPALGQGPDPWIRHQDVRDVHLPR